MRRVVISWSVVVAAMAVLFTVTIVILNSTLFSAPGFARVYLDSLARHDAVGALRLPGVLAPDGTDPALLVDDALGELGDIRIVGDSSGDDGTRLIEVESTFGPGRERTRTTLAIEPAPPVLGVFNGWRFAQTPIAVIAAEPLHDASFEVNGVALRSDGPIALAALAPGRYVLTHETALFSAEPVTADATAPGSIVPATLDIRANASFVERVQQELNDFLDDCATQRVLLPAGCPFGQQISNRIESEPEWSISSYPTVVIEPGAARGMWVMPPADATAHLTVEVRSLFDGTRSTFDEDVPFAVSYEIRVQPDGSLQITAAI